MDDFDDIFEEYGNYDDEDPIFDFSLEPCGWDSIGKKF